MGSEAAEPHVNLARASDGLVTGTDPVLDDQRRRIVRRAPAARVHGKCEVKDRLTRGRRDPQAKEPAATRVADAREGQTPSVRARRKQPQRCLRADDVELPGCTAMVVPIGWPRGKAGGERHARVSEEARDHELVWALAKRTSRDRSSEPVTLPAAYRVAVVEATGDGPDVQHHRIRGRGFHDAGGELGIPPGEVFGSGEGFNRWRQRIR